MTTIQLLKYIDYCKKIADERLGICGNNPRQVTKYGKLLELIGAYAEVGAMIYLGLTPILRVGYDNGYDFIYKNLRVDTKGTKSYPNMRNFNLQWPIDKPLRENGLLKSDVILLLAIDMNKSVAYPTGWVWTEELEAANINHKRPIPCMEIRIPLLKDPRYLLNTDRIRKERELFLQKQLRPSEKEMAAAWLRS